MSIPIRGTSWVVPAEVIDASSGAGFAGTVTVTISIDGAARVAGTGAVTNLGGGLYSYAASELETGGSAITFVFSGTGAVPSGITIPTVTTNQAAAASVVSGTIYTPTVLDLITGSLLDLNMCSAGDTPDPNDVQMAFLRFNDFIDDLKNEALSIYTILRTTWTLVNGTASYTVGLTGTIAIDRPVSPQAITNIGYLDTSLVTPYERLIGPPLTEDMYASIPFKTLSTVYPTAFYYNPTTPPTGRLWVFPIPTSSTLQGVIYTQSPIGEYAALSDPIILPPGYRRFFRNQLTIELASAFEKQPPPAVVQAAKESRAKIKRVNTRLSDISFDPALTMAGRKANIYTGDA